MLMQRPNHPEPHRIAMGRDHRDLNTILDQVGLELLQRDGFANHINPESCVLLVHMHILPSTTLLFKHLRKKGFLPDRIVIIPKCYSTVESSKREIEELGCTVLDGGSPTFSPGRYDDWARDLLKKGIYTASNLCTLWSAKRCILVDDGGLLTDIWYREGHQRPGFDIISIQLTESGLYRRRRMTPAFRINVARAPAKVEFESKIVVRGVLAKVSSLHIVKKCSRIGVIGLGRLGSRLASMLQSRGHDVFSFDLNSLKNPEIKGRQLSWRDCVRKADVIFGCTGRNQAHFDSDTLAKLATSKSFFSLSSRDVEFQSFLRLCSTRKSATPFDPVEVVSQVGGRHVFYNGGFPINFDREKEWEASSDIALTRSLVLLAILQAICVKPAPDAYHIAVLAPRAQQELVREWLKLRGMSPEDYGVSCLDFDEEAWWENKSKDLPLFPHYSYLGG